MKTQKKTFRGIVTSSIFALSLVTGLVPAGALAYAAESAPQVINDLVQVAPGVEGTGDDTNGASENAADINEPTNASVQNDDANSGEGNAEASDASASAPVQPESTEGSGVQTGATSGYTTIDTNRISATVALNAEETVVVGDVEYEGLTYRINEDGETATLIGFGTSKPSGNLVIPSRIATTGKLYTVTNIGSTKAGGGGSLR